MPRLSSRVYIAYRLARVPLSSAVLLALAMPTFAQVTSSPGATPDATTVYPALKLDRALNEKRTTPPDALPAFARAQQVSGTNGQGLVLQGDAEVRKNGSVLRGDRITYTQLADEVDVDGHARLFTRGSSFSGPSLRYKVDAGTGTMPDASYVYSPRGGRGTSSLIEFLGDDRARLNNATYSTCAPDDDSWWVKAEKIDMDKVDESGVGRWACLYFKGVPVLPLPYFTFPLGGQRRSGLLTPSLGFSSTKGTDVTVPYYFNLAPNYDLTVAPRVLSRRGVLLQDEFRYLSPTNLATFNYDILPNDRVTGTTRDLLRLVDTYASPEGISGAINYTRVSDDNFFRDFSNSIVGSSQSVLTQDAYVGLYRSEWNTAIRITKNQTLQDPLNPVVKPYERVPQLTFNAFRTDIQGFDTSLGLDATHFEHPTLDSGTRYIANPKVSYPFLAPGWFVIPRAQLSSTYYSMDEATSPVIKESSRTLPIASLDAGLVFDRDVTWFGRAAQQTLEPRLYYAYIPYRDQSKLPNFDSALPDLNFSQFFTENAYSGNDRIGEANQLTAAISTRVLDSETGLERLRATLGQRYYADTQRVTLPGGVPRTSNSSDLLAAVTGVLSRSLAIDTALQYSAEQNQIQRATVGARWQPAAASVLSAYYRYRIGDISQVDVAAEWPITSRWYGVARTNYSMKDKSLIEALAGLEYKADCWVLRVVAQRFVTSTLTYTTNFFIQLELNGLGGIGTSPVEQLRRNIPGYQLVNPLPHEPGRFDYYE